MTQNTMLYCPIQKLPKHLETHVLHLEIGDNGYNEGKDDALKKLAEFIKENFQVDDVYLLGIELRNFAGEYYKEHF